MTSRDSILRDLRRNAPPLSPLPPAVSGIEYADTVKQFEETFASVAGRCVHVADTAALREAVAKLDVYAKARTVASLVKEIDSRNIEPQTVEDPHQLAGVDVAVLLAEFGVAENGAVWIPGSVLGPNRAIFVIAQSVVLVLNAKQVVSNMHQAYERVQMERPGFGLFLSGPSKTADIEQSLVIGAHGARSCTLFLVGAH
jgi:L-lactate dehydrogenase complex protein LldG